ncbi:MAG: adenylosuccinate lyase [Rhodobacterales bacterium]|nr:adenylosuccinate lyase [Rhodobacterales bacterium]
MKLRVLLASAALALAPGLALAMCGHDQVTAGQCAPGQTWDAETQSCVTPVGS